MADSNSNNPASAPQSSAGDENPKSAPTINFDSNDPLTLKGPFRYPKDTSKEQTFIRFKSYDYSKAQTSEFSKQVFNLGDVTKDVSEKIISLTKSLGVEQKPGEPSKKNVYSEDIIDLYVPPGIKIDYGANWSGTAALGVMGSNYGGVFQNLAGASYNSLVNVGADAIAEILKGVGKFNADGEQLVGLTTGLVFNKNEFSTFNNIPMRSFTYSFIFVGRSKKEIEEINRIINIFKISMHPRSLNLQNPIDKDTNARPPILKYPKLWTIEYITGGKPNSYLPKTKFCGIQNLSLNYTPNSVFTTLAEKYGYNIPAIQMDINFKELTPLIGDEIIEPSVAGGLFAGGGIDKNYNNKKEGGTF